METRGVFYLLTGVAHAVRTVVSMWNLRKHFDGPITLYTTQDESHEIGRKCVKELRLGIDHRTTDELPIKKNRQFITKVHLLPNAPCDVNMYLDGDTLPMGDVTPILDLASEHEFCATQFCTWTTGGKMIGKRLRRWTAQVARGQPEEAMVDHLVAQALDPPMPAINGGVFAARRDAAILVPWYELSMLGRRTHICDEVALQMLLREYPSTILEGGRYNCSGHLGGDVSDPIIMHYHGEKHLRREPSRVTWIPAYNECIRENVAGIQSWTPAGDPSLAKFLKQSEAA